ncbi:MAG: rhomboid family intramembrane serine protease [Erysipelotrichaceae bacterium]
MEKESKIIALKVVEILKDKYDYQDIIFNMNDKQFSKERSQKEIWLHNYNNQKFPIIRVSYLNSSDTYFNDKEAPVMIKAFDENQNEIEVKVLNIYTGNYVSEYSNDVKSITVGVNEELSWPIEILDVFPALSEIVIDKEHIDEQLKQTQEKLISQNMKKLKALIKEQNRIPKVTLVIAVICGVIYGLSFIINNMTKDLVTTSIVLGGYYKALVFGANEYWRLFTSMFVHVDFVHAFFNIYALINVGRIIEKIVDKWVYLGTLLISGFVGSLFVLIGNGNIVSNGLSGGLYGLLAMMIVFFISSGRMKDPYLRRQIYSLLLINIMISLLPNISFLAHLGGFVAGLLCGLGYFYFKSMKSLAINSLIVLSLLTSGLFGYSLTNRQLDEIYPGTDIKVVETYGKLNLGFYGDYLSQRLSDFYRQLGE